METYTKLAIHGCGGLATCGGGYLATPLTFPSCGLAKACSCSSIPFNAFGCSYSHLTGLEFSHGFLAARSCPFSHPMPSQVSIALGKAEPPLEGLAKWL